MFDFVSQIPHDLHPIVVHLPIALLLVSFALTIGARWRPGWHETSWILLVIGGLATLPAIATGLAAHEPYEDTPVESAISTHERLALIGSLVTLAVLVWRWLSRRRGADAGTTTAYLVVVAVGLVWLTVLGGTGGQLTYGDGVNVRATNPAHANR